MQPAVPLITPNRKARPCALNSLLGFVMLGILVGCQRDPYAHEYTHAEPTVAELSGRYGLDSTTARFLSTRSAQEVPDATLVLRSDGSFAATNVPGAWRSEATHPVDLEHFEGSWTIAKHQEWWSVQLRCTQINGLTKHYQLPVMVRRDAPPRLLHITLGDPDSGEALTFERRGNATEPPHEPESSPKRAPRNDRPA